jgi:transmembrane sensor
LAFFVGGKLFPFIKNLIIGPRENYNEVIVPLGESAEVVLSDQTHVWLNSGSKFKYPSEFNTGSRMVELSGEAFFDVTKNKKQPFIVITPELRVKVLGTNFNLEATPNSEITNITLVEGIVNVESSNEKFISQLKPNQRAIFNRKSHTLKISQVDTKLYTSWKKGIIYFRDEPLEKIASKLENWFNLEIIFDDPELKKIKYTGTILKNKPIDQLLDILSYTANVDSEIEIKNLNPSVVHIKRKPME